MRNRVRMRTRVRAMMHPNKRSRTHQDTDDDSSLDDVTFASMALPPPAACGGRGGGGGGFCRGGGGAGGGGGGGDGRLSSGGLDNGGGGGGGEACGADWSHRSAPPASPGLGPGTAVPGPPLALSAASPPSLGAAEGGGAGVGRGAGGGIEKIHLDSAEGAEGRRATPRLKPPRRCANAARPRGVYAYHEAFRKDHATCMY